MVLPRRFRRTRSVDVREGYGSLAHSASGRHGPYSKWYLVERFSRVEASSQRRCREREGSSGLRARFELGRDRERGELFLAACTDAVLVASEDPVVIRSSCGCRSARLLVTTHNPSPSSSSPWLPSTVSPVFSPTPGRAVLDEPRRFAEAQPVGPDYADHGCAGRLHVRGAGRERFGKGGGALEHLDFGGGEANRVERAVAVVVGDAVVCDSTPAPKEPTTTAPDGS